jgi:hypothetical protein
MTADFNAAKPYPLPGHADLSLKVVFYSGGVGLVAPDSILMAVACITAAPDLNSRE